MARFDVDGAWITQRASSAYHPPRRDVDLVSLFLYPRSFHVESHHVLSSISSRSSTWISREISRCIHLDDISDTNSLATGWMRRGRRVENYSRRVIDSPWAERGAQTPPRKYGDQGMPRQCGNEVDLQWAERGAQSTQNPPRNCSDHPWSDFPWSNRDVRVRASRGEAG